MKTVGLLGVDFIKCFAYRYAMIYISNCVLNYLLWSVKNPYSNSWIKFCFAGQFFQSENYEAYLEKKAEIK